MTSYLIDTHSHIYSEEFDQDRNEVVSNAHKAGIKKILLPNIDSSTIKRMLELSDAYPKHIFPMMGLHPTSVKKNYEEELKVVEKWLEQKHFYAIGEIGIDLHWDKTFLKEQEIVFERQIDLALQYNLPIVIHARKSFEQIFKILDKKHTAQLKGVFHSFTGSLEQARRITEKYQFYLGINGTVTFKNSKLPSVLADIDIKHILLETDSPYLTPEPKRGKRNESAYVSFIAQKIAYIYNLDLSTLADITSQNANKLFKLPKDEN